MSTLIEWSHWIANQTAITLKKYMMSYHEPTWTQTGVPLTIWFHHHHHLHHHHHDDDMWSGEESLNAWSSVLTQDCSYHFTMPATFRACWNSLRIKSSKGSFISYFPSLNFNLKGRASLLNDRVPDEDDLGWLTWLREVRLLQNGRIFGKFPKG